MIRFLLLHRIEETDKHPNLMFALAVAAMLVAMCFAPSVPQ